MKKFKSVDYVSAVTQEQLSVERWADVVINGFKYDYKISDCGRLLSCKTGKILKPSLDKRGYPQNTFYKTAKENITRRVHKLVALHFIENPINLPEVNHKDGNKFNPHYSNLEHSTSKHNKQHAVKLGLARFPLINIKKKKVIDDATGLIYPSLKDASSKTGIGYDILSNGLRGITKNKTSLRYL